MRLPTHTILSRKRTQQKGAAVLLVVLLLLTSSLVVVAGFTGPLARELQGARTLESSRSAYFLAEAGNEDAYYRLKNSMQISSTEVMTLNGNTATTSIVDIGGGGKEITSLGEVLSRQRKVKTEISTSVTGVDFFYGAQVGAGGVQMSNNSRIEGAGGTAGNIYSNGPIVGDSGTVITGDAIVATGVAEDVQARSTVCNQDQIVGKTSPEIDFAQSFSPSDTKPLSKVSLYIKKSGNPASVPVRIVADNSGSPATVSLADGTLDKNLVGSSYGWIDIVFPSPATLTNGQTYWIVLDASQNNSKYWTWCRDSNNGFGNGVGKYNSSWSSGSWTQITGDLAFKTYLGEGISTISDMQIDGVAKANTITDSTIGGDAYYDTNFTGSTAGGTEYPGSPDPSPLGLPISDSNVADWKADALAGGTVTGNCPGAVGCSNDMGPVKIDGNLSPSGVTFTVDGTIHVTGNFVPGNNTTIRCALGYGSNSCTIVVDGWVDINNNVTFQGSGDPDSYMLILSTLSGCNGGAQQGGCGPNNSAVNISNNATGAIFYASDSLIHLGNNVNITSVVGRTLFLSNNVTITYEVGVADLDFSSGPGGGWKINEWKEVE